MLKNRAWVVSLKDVQQNIKDSKIELKQNTIYVFYPIFLLYSVTTIFLLKLAQILLG